MKTCNLSLATVALGALAVSYAACGAQGQDNSVPGAPTGPEGQAGGDTVGTAGTVSTPNAASGSSGASPGHPSAGAPTHFGGAPNTGVGGAKPYAGAPGRAGAPGTGSPASGGAGAPPTTSGCTLAAGTLAEPVIDDLEDGDDAIKATGARVGYWYTYNDGTLGALQVPAPAAPFKATAPGSTASPKFAATTSGPKFTMWGAGMGFDFHSVASKSCPYDASAYTGIKFWAKSNTAALSLKSMIKIPATTSTTAEGGTCPATAKCEDHFSITSTLTTAWAEYKMPFATIAQEKFGTPATFTPKSLLAVQFQVAMGVAFDFSIDDISFY